MDDVAKTLGLADSKQAYVLYLWLDYTIQLTVHREQFGGNQEYVVIAQTTAPSY